MLELGTTIPVSDLFTLPVLCTLVLDRANTPRPRLVARVESENNDKVASIT